MPRRSSWRHWLLAAATALLAAGCGGGGTSGSGGTGAVEGLSVGTVTGFGSIIVDGVRYDDRSTRVSLDTESGAPDAVSGSPEIKLGQHVEVRFNGGESASSASGLRISPEVVGVVSAVSPDLVVAGQVVKVNTDAAAGPVTVFEGYASAADILVGDRIEVHAIVLADGTVQATRIERKPKIEPWLRVTGTIAALASDGSSFQLGTLTVNVASTTRIVPAGAVLANGQRVVVWSDTAISAGSITAKFVRVKRHSGDAAFDARVSGPITDCSAPCEANFKVGGITVNASSAEFAGGTKADLANGKWVHLRGTLDPVANTLTASRVVFHRKGGDDDRNEVRLKGAITDFVDLANFKVRGVPVTTDSSTVTGASCTAPLGNGTLVSIKGAVSGFKVLAKTIECFTIADGVTLEAKGRIVTIDATARTFTLDGALLGGLTFSYGDGTEFRDGASAADLAVGVKLEVKGTVSGSTVTVTRIHLEDEVSSPVGVNLFETEGIASGVTKSGEAFIGLVVNGLTFTMTPATVLVTRDGPLVDGAKVKVVFRKEGTSNIALLVRTDD
jgi:hypothetical protein